MNTRIIKFKILFLILTSLFVSGNISDLVSSEILTTDHFIINFNLNNSSCAVALAGRLESYNESAASFLEIETMEKINVFITSERNINFNPINKSNELYISTDSDLTDPENIIYNKIFLFNLRSIMNDGKGLSTLDVNFINAIIGYTVTEKNLAELIVNDLVNNSSITSIEFDKINKYTNDVQLSIYTALINFIITVYDKKILIQTLKDADYYGGFYDSLSSITGDSITSISEKFNSYLKKHESDLYNVSNSKKQMQQESDEFIDTCYSISENGQIAVLQKKSDSFRVVIKNEKNNVEINLDHSENGTIFNNLIFLDNEQLALTEIHKSGSTIHIYNTVSNQSVGKVFLPYLFISGIDYSGDKKFIFSAVCGLTCDVYTLDMNSGILKILTESGNNYSPVILKDKAYFISGTNKSSIIEFNIRSGEMKTLFSTDQKISRLKSANGEILIFSLKINDLDNIYTLDVQSGNLRKYINDIASCISPGISGPNIYYLSFFKSKYRLFFTAYNPADI